MARARPARPDDARLRGCAARAEGMAVAGPVRVRLRRRFFVAAAIAVGAIGGCGGTGRHVAKPGTAAFAAGAEPMCPATAADRAGLADDDRAAPDVDYDALAGRRIVAVELRGAPAIAKQLAPDIALHAGDPLDRRAIDDQLRQLWRLGLLDDARAEVEPAGDDGVRVALVVHPRAIVTGIDLDIHGDLAPGKLRRLRALAGVLDDPGRARRTAQRLEDELRGDGHWHARVVAVDRRAADGSIRLCVGVDAGRRYRIATVRFPGARAIDPKDLAALIEQRDGAVNAVGGAYRADLLDADLLRIQSAYFEIGRVMVHVGAPVTKVDEAHGRIELSIPVEEGKKFAIGAIAFTGVAPELVASYRSLLGVREGTVFARMALAAGLERIREAERKAGRGGNVEPMTSIDVEAARIDLTLEVTP